MHDNILSDVFIELGLSAFDLDIYQKILGNSKITATALAIETSSNRVKVYQSLHILHQNEIILFQPFAKNKILPQNPQNILSKVKYKATKLKNLSQKFETIMPELMGEYSFDLSKNFIEYKGFADMFLLLQQLTEIIPNNGESLWFNETSELTHFFRDFFFGQYGVERIGRNVKLRILANPQNKVHWKFVTPENSGLRKIKYLPQEFGESSTYVLSKDSVIFWNIPQLKAYWIKDKMLCDTLTAVFENYWKTLK
jgi:predicted transcriptional regulator